MCVRYLSIFSVVVALTTGCKDQQQQSANQSDTTQAARKPVAVNEVVGVAVVEPSARITELSTQSGGIVRRINVRIGQTLIKGQPVVVLDNAVETAQLQQATSKITTQQQAIKASWQNRQKLVVQLQKAQADWQRSQQLFTGNALTKQELDDARYAVDNLQQQIGASDAELKQAQSRLTELRADIRYYATLLSQKAVKAPENGTLLSLNAKLGQYLAPNQAIGEFAPAGPLMALTEIDELFAAKIRIGQKAVIRAPGSDEVLTAGTVTLTSPYLRKKSLFSDNADNLEDRRVREVRVQLDQPGNVLIGARVESLIRVAGVR